MQVAALAGKLSAELTRALADEASGPSGNLLPIPTDGQDKTVKDLRADLQKIAGQTVLVQAGSWAVDGAPTTTGWEPRRLGAAPPQSLVGLSTFASAEVFAAIGVSPSLFGSGTGGGAAREAYRAFLHTVVQPLARIVAYELGRKLGPVELGFSALAASDVTAKSRAYASLISSGMGPDQAQRITGLT